MIYQVSLNDDPDSFKECMEIEPEAFLYALECVEFLKKALLYLFEFEINTSDGWYGKRKQAYLKKVRKYNGRIKKRKLQQDSNDSAKQFHEVIGSLIQEGHIIEEEGDIVIVKNY